MRFRGSEVWNSKAGILIKGNEKERLLLLNANLHYVLVLPYSTDWVFNNEDPHHLKGNAGTLNMDVQITDAEVSPDEHLAQLQEYLLHESPIASKVDLITHKGDTVLRAESDGASIDPVLKGFKHVNFYRVKTWGQYQYKLHFSKVVLPNGPDPVSDEKILDFVTKGFFVDYQREQESKEPQPRSFALPQHGWLTFNVPSTWKQTVQRPPDNLPPTITFTPAQGDDFQVLITPIWSPKKDTTFNKSGAINKLIGNDLKNMLPDAVEKEVPIQEFASIDGTGFYFLLTDKATKPGEYPYAVRAGVGVGDLLLSVTVLSRSKDTEGITATIKALQEARQSVK
jgi:hypothetical protein